MIPHDLRLAAGGGDDHGGGGGGSLHVREHLAAAYRWIIHIRQIYDQLLQIPSWN
jgi:hypothetical protein